MSDDELLALLADRSAPLSLEDIDAARALFARDPRAAHRLAAWWRIDDHLSRSLDPGRRDFANRLRSATRKAGTSSRFVDRVHAAAESTRSRPRHKSPLLMWATAMAACLALAIGGLWRFHERTAAEPTVAGAAGWIERGDARLALTAGRAETLLTGDLVAADGVALVIRYTDGTSIDLSDHGRLGIRSSDRDVPKSLQLEQGTLTASVAKQPEGHPMRFGTPQSTVTVVGTRLSIAIVDDTTTVSVAEGKVAVTHLDDGSVEPVAAGGSAAVTGIALGARSTRPGMKLYVDKDHPVPGKGTSADPFQTIQMAFDVAQPGDDIRIRKAGTPYDERVTSKSSGAPGRPIIVEADDANDPPILRYASDDKMAAAIQILGHSHWTIRHLTFDGTGFPTATMAVWIRALEPKSGASVTGIQILDNVFKNWGAAGSAATAKTDYVALEVDGGWGPPAGARTIDGTIIRGNRFDGNRRISIDLASTTNSIVEGNDISRSTGGLDWSGTCNAIGIQTITGSRDLQTGDVIRNNAIHDFDPSSAWKSAGVPGSYASQVGIWINTGSVHGTIEGNRIWNLDQANMNSTSPSLGIHLGHEAHGWTIRNNVITNIGWGGMLHDPLSAGEATRYLNNTIVDVGVEALRFVAGNAVVENNIFVDARQAQIVADPSAIAQGGLSIDFNEYWDRSGGKVVGRWGGDALDLAGWRSASHGDLHSLNVDPRFVDPAADDFHLRPDSPLIDAGIAVPEVTTDQDGIARPRGLAPDLGAFER